MKIEDWEALTPFQKEVLDILKEIRREIREGLE